MTTFFTSYLGGTHGTAKSARDFLRALLANQTSVKVVAPNQEQYPDFLCSRKLSVPQWFDMPQGLRPPRHLNEFNPNRIRDWLNDRSAIRRLRSSELVVVNGWASYNHWLISKDSFTGPKVIIVRESPRHFAGPDCSQAAPDLLGGFSNFDAFIFVSEQSCHEWRQQEVFASKPYAILPNCCEEEDVIRCTLQDRETVRKGLGFRPDDFVVICPGTIEHRKGQDLLLGVVPELNSKIPNLKIVLVGDPATMWGDLLNAIPVDLLGRTVKHVPAMPDIIELLYAADLLAFPSRAEALPRTILEAMVMKTPIVASDVDGIPELIDDGESGLLFSGDDKDGLLKAILRCYADPDLREKMSEKASEKYWISFSRSIQFSRMADVLHILNNNFNAN
ncbi:MAG: glycosyltransferase family 4 protein [Saprospiraceae bacterium]|nr:glycosyltransferase family 4 protein [Candidatus Brachybacter algidus]